MSCFSCIRPVPLRPVSYTHLEIGIAMIDGTPTLVISPQQRHPDTAITEPTERSIPPNMITIVIPHARITLMDICRMMLERFLTVQNESVMTLSNRQMIKRPMIIPPLYLTVETTFLPKPGKDVYKRQFPY